MAVWSMLLDLVGNWMNCAQLIPVCHDRLVGLYVDGVLIARMTHRRGLGSSSVCSNITNEGVGECPDIAFL